MRKAVLLSACRPDGEERKLNPAGEPSSQGLYFEVRMAKALGMCRTFSDTAEVAFSLISARIVRHFYNF